jgi:hypothetical protein
VVAATYVWLLVLLGGTPNTGYEARVLYKTETLAKCQEHAKFWVDAFPEMTNLTLRIRCVKHDQKNMQEAYN